MTIFGNRDSGSYGGSPAGESSSEDIGAQLPEDRVADRPTAPAASPFSVDTRRVVIRVHGGDDVVVSRVEGRDQAVLLARETVRTVEQASARGEWPEIQDRFLRPGAILSIDVQRAE